MLTKKERAVRLDRDSGAGTKIVSILEEKQNEPCLSEKQIKEIANITKKISTIYNRPQDIEWAIANDSIYILQTRPITTLNITPDKTQNKTIWDNSNIVESYSGVTTPLTFSFISIVYREVYKQFCRIMGVEEDLICKNDHIFSMIGLIKGRVYYNLINWYNLLSLLPGYSINSGFMEQMMGVKEKLEAPLTAIKSDKNQYLRLVNLIYNIIKNLFILPLEIKKFYQLLDNTLLPYKKLDLASQNANDLKEHYLKIERSLIKKWDAPLVNDFFAMIFYGVLKKIIVKWGIDETETLQNNLLIGQGDIISTQPIRNIREIANIICQDDQLKKLFSEEDNYIILKNLPDYDHVNSKILNYIDKFGDRCINELKLETITYRHKPEMLIELIKTYVKTGYVEANNEDKKRQLAHQKIETALRGKPVKKIFI